MLEIAPNLCNRRGRPLGFKLSDESKKAISDSKRGQHHNEETKAKISKSLMLYFKKQNPMSDELYCKYYGFGAVFCDWLQNTKNDLDNSDVILTYRAMKNICKKELTCGNYIEYFSHEMTPELIILFKEYCELLNINPEEVFDKI